MERMSFIYRTPVFRAIRLLSEMDMYKNCRNIFSGTLRVRPSQSLSGETNQRIVYFDGTKVQINEELRMKNEEFLNGECVLQEDERRTSRDVLVSGAALLCYYWLC